MPERCGTRWRVSRPGLGIEVIAGRSGRYSHGPARDRAEHAFAAVEAIKALLELTPADAVRRAILGQFDDELRNRFTEAAGSDYAEIRAKINLSPGPAAEAATRRSNYDSSMNYVHPLERNSMSHSVALSLCPFSQRGSKGIKIDIYSATCEPSSPTQCSSPHPYPSPPVGEGKRRGKAIVEGCD